MNASKKEKSSPSLPERPAFPTSISYTNRAKTPKSSPPQSSSSSTVTSYTTLLSGNSQRIRTSGIMNGFLGDYGRAASSPSLMINSSSNRPATALSAASGLSSGTSSSQTVSAIKSERDLLERMVQERDEKISTLQRTIDMQKEYIDGLQEKNDKVQEKMKQEAARQKLHLQSVTHEKNLIRNQLKVMQRENARIKNDPIHQALTMSSSADGNGLSQNNDDKIPPILSQDEEDSINSLDEEAGQKALKYQVKILDNDQRCLVLQSQLFQAMNSLSTLQQQTSALKENYDEIVNSLQQELMDAEEAKTKVEVKLLSRMTVLEREKAIVEELLNEKIRARDSRLKRLEKRIQSLDSIDDDESIAADSYDMDGREKDSTNSNDNKGGEKNKVNDDAHHGDDEDDHDDHDDANSDLDSTLGVHAGDAGEATAVKSNRKELLSELEMLSEHSSTRKLFSNVE